MARNKYARAFNPKHRAAAIVVLLLLTSLFAIMQFWINRNLYQQLDTASSIQVKVLIVDAVKNLGRSAVVEPLSGKQYLPDAKLVLPATNDSPQLKYSVHADVVTISDVSHVSQAAAKVLSGQNMTDTFDKVPTLQACSRQVILQYTDQGQDDTTLVASKQLKNGRTVYIFETKGCATGAAELIAYIRQIDSY